MKNSVKTSMENFSNTGKIVGGLLVAAIVGATVGVLLAPESGSNTRNMLIGGAKDLADDLVKNLKDQANSLLSKAEELEGLAKGKMHELTNGVKQKVDTMKTV